MGQEGKSAIPELLKTAAHPNYDIQQAALEALFSIDPSAVVGTSILLSQLEAEDRFELPPVLWREMGTRNSAIVNGILGILINPHLSKKVRVNAIEVLGHIGPVASGAVSELVAFIKGRNKILRDAATEALRRISRSSLLQVLDDSLFDEDVSTREWAVGILAIMEPKKDSVFRLLCEALKANEESVRALAAKALASCGTVAIPCLSQALREDSSKNVRISCDEALKAIEGCKPRERAVLESIQHPR